MTNVYDTLEERGFVAQVTDQEAVRELLGGPPITVYIGYDPTARSLHVGNLFTMMGLAHLERAGHRCIALLGGGTAMVGDPSGKTEMRKLLSPEDISTNAELIKSQLGTVLDVSGGKTLVVNNAEWLLSLSYIEFLREVGRHFSVNRMLAAEAYKQRLERGLSFIEFNYQLLQAYDYVELRRRYNCRLQMGGDDQWGNILAGVDLNRRMDAELVHGLTFPLQLTATGEKMGKTATGAVWLSAELLSPYEYYQYWVNAHDQDVQKYLGFFTFLPMDEVRQVSAMEGAEINVAKSVLAYEATKIVHGEEKARESHRAAMAGFGGRELPAHILPSSTVPRAAAADVTQLPTLELTKEQLQAGISILDVMVQCELAKSKGEARRLITQGAIKLGHEKITDQLRNLTLDDFPEGAVLLRAGKKRLHRLVCR